MAREVISGELIVSDAAFQYLRLQKGRLEPLADDRERWHIAYEHDLRTTYEEVERFLPERCWAMLDIGSGLGGIDVLFHRHYVARALRDGAKPGSQLARGPYVNLLDGEADAPEMRLHRETFNDMRVARDFQKANGVPADRFAYYTPATREIVKPYDLVVSFGSWCFHYPPNEYLPRLISGGGLHAGSVVIIDFRNGKPEWERQLGDAGFRILCCVRSTEKYKRLVLCRP